ncbi:MAG TPA: cyclopropane fatty acyl phospholipid synthase [Candidatus Acidoferrales bacterium]|nr:cyclopropane fatty acyl phospholipid synthase [Candidatus Acidoferrales bacterium]
MTPRRTQDGNRWNSRIRKRLQSALEEAGITFDGPNPWDPQIRNPRVFRRLLLHGTLGAGEAYVDGDWECDRLDELSAQLLSSGIAEKWDASSAISPGRLVTRLINRQSRLLARRNVKAHYDIGNDLFSAMLGQTMAYSCGYWQEAKTLDEAQEAKHELVCRKLQLRPGLRILDIGCGWGGFARYAAEHHEVDVTGVTVSQAQAEFAREHCQGLPVEIRLEDFRDVRGSFDRIVSIGMFEHVGPKNYRTYLESVRRNLVPDGLFLLHTIGGLRPALGVDPWFDRYIFPNAVLPSGSQILQVAEGLLVLEDWHNFGADYDKTLMAWHANFESAWPALRERYGERFRRMWRYYLMTLAGSFRVRRIQLWQIVFSKRGVAGGYRRAGA